MRTRRIGKKISLFFFLISFLGGCKVESSYWNAEIYNNGNQVHLINMVLGRSLFFLHFLPDQKCTCKSSVLVSFSGKVKYLFKNDSSVSVDLYKVENNSQFTVYNMGMREDGKDATFAFCSVPVDCSFDQIRKSESIREIYYSVKGKILVGINDTLDIESEGKFIRGNWEGNWKSE
jgi:hypothetical protein